MDKGKKPQESDFCEEHYELSLTEVSVSFGVSQSVIEEMLSEGIIPVKQGQAESLRFSGNDLLKLRKALSLYHDLGINFAGAALALELLDEIDRLEQALHIEKARR